MRAKKLLIWTWVALVMLMFTGTAWADVYFSIATAEDWEEALYGGSIKPVTADVLRRR